jgi:AcrR family transcriptional regulator
MTASKKEELIDKALEVFYREGFHATGMDRLVAVTGISKTSMYKHFKTKEDLILATLERRHKYLMTLIIDRTDERADTPAARLIASFDSLKDWIAGGRFQSCMFIKASSEFQDPSHPIHKISADHKRTLQDYFVAQAKAANARNPEQLGHQLMLLQEGAIVTAHMQGGSEAADDAKAAAEVLVAAALA